MKKFYFLATFLCCLFLQQTTAQERYIDEVFTDADITMIEDVHYATNMSILAKLFVPGVDVPTPELLKGVVYMPSASVDSEASRPVVIIPVGDNALPQYTQACYGATNDLFTRTLAGKLARRGYVVLAIKMRVGWNPLVTLPNDFLRELADGVQRQAQDVKAAARFLRKDVAENGNSYGIDPNKILLWGAAQGAGTVSLTAAYITKEEEFQTPNYIVQDEQGELVNVYDGVLFGNVEGTEPGFEPGGAISNLPSQNGCYSSEFNMVVTAGGVNLDTFMIQAGETPSVHFTAGNWVAASVPAGPLNLPATGDLCCFVYFAHTYQRQADQLGNLDAWKGIEFSNPIANTRLDDPTTPEFDPIEGMYAFGGEPANQFPWVYWDEAACEAVNPDVAALTKSQRVGASMEFMVSAMDDMMAYALPRACITLDLGCQGITTGLREEVVESERIAVSPNPSTGIFVFETPVEHTMEAIHIYDISGKLMYKTEVYHHIFTAANLDLADGLYIAKIKFEDGVASKKLTVGN